MEAGCFSFSQTKCFINIKYLNILLISKDIRLRTSSKTGVTAFNRFTWAKTITNLNSFDAGRAAILGGEGEKENLLFIF